MNFNLLLHVMLSKAQSQQTSTSPKSCLEHISHLIYHMTIKDSSRQSLCEGIHQVLYRSDLLHNHISSHYYLTYQVIFPRNVFTIPVVSWFFTLCHHLTIITKHYHGRYSYRHYPKSQQELLKPSNFLCCFRSSNILDFHSGVNNIRFFHNSSTNNPITQSVHKIIIWFSTQHRIHKATYYKSIGYLFSCDLSPHLSYDIDPKKKTFHASRVADPSWNPASHT